ncbi:GspE/PulE family protein [uncultured Clostridium sp.]|uniref:GspE/PulE family protein n=1 Tax=uncultured Clostridium sp. TaxID=59620 RepID=UPI002628C0A4|nr:GspE/PulE family protein [uncultured Clostridium sp.]
MNITKEIIDTKAMKRIPKTMASKFNMVMTRDDDDNLVACSDSITMDKKLYLNLVFNKEIDIKKIEKRKVVSMIKEYNSNRENSVLNENYIAVEVKKIIDIAIKKGASDIHIEPEIYFSNIRFRINGDLVLHDRLSKDDYQSIINRIKVLSAMDISNRLEPQDGKMKVDIGIEQMDVRVSSIPTTNGEKLVLRVLYKDEGLNKLSNLNFSKKQTQKIERLLKFKNGMIIVNGPTGSGKSTTLYALLNELDKNMLNICTLEDPVEFDMPMITQSNINEKVGFTFSNALRYVLRQDPDVIFVGEIRDEETAKMSVRSSITGHKVLSTIHTSSGGEVENRLLNMGVEKYLLDDALLGIITQRLIKTLCKACREKYDYEVDGEIKALYKACGCSLCSNTGYSGRTVVAEVVNLKDEEDIKWGDELLESVKELVLNGEITFDDYIIFKDSEGLGD